MNMLKKSLALLLTLCMLFSMIPLTVSASTLTVSSKPSDGTTTNAPFPKGTGGSNSFRIPALVTLKNGNLVAAADARWNTTYDGGGLDTIVARSYDSGSNWSYTFANYLGDNGNEYNGSSSTAFIDPALAVDGNTVYMLVDLYPYGIALNGSGNTAPSTHIGFDDNGYLVLSKDGNYNYYLNGDTIYSYTDGAVSGYTVDEYFNITGTDGTSSNLFFSDSPYKVVRTGFLYLTKSTDAGKTWSAPELLNLKTSSEQVCLVAPGRGLVTSNGNIIFPVYSYNGSQSSQQMSYISYDGKSWSRSTSMTGASWSSESAVVELTSGALRFFYRNGTTNLCYVDYNNGWGTPVTMTSIDTNSNCQISAITYSKTIDGKQVILVSCPTGPSEAGSDESGASYRLNGKIFAFTVESNGSLNKVGSISVTSNDNQFMYSCLTELSDGTVAILYENKESAWGTGTNCYYTMDYAEYDLTTAMGLTFDTTSSGEDSDDTEETFNTAVSDDGIEITSETEVTAISGLTDFVAYDITLSKDGANYTDSATVTLPLNKKFAEDVALWGFVLESDGSITYVKENVTRDTVNDTVTFTAPHFSTVGAMPAAEEELQDEITSSGIVYKLATTFLAGEEYIIVNTSSDGTGYALTNYNGEGGVARTEVAISNGVITNLNEDNDDYVLWNINGTSNALVKNGDYYVYLGSSTLLSESSRSLNIVSQGDGEYNINRSNSNYYLYYKESSAAWTRASSTQSVYLFQKVNAAYLVNAAKQDKLIIDLTLQESEGGNYTDTSWNAYKAALNAANTKLATVEGTDYATESEASAALVDLKNAVNTLEEAKDALVKAITITVNYKANGTKVATGTLNVAVDVETATLPSSVTGSDGTTYTVKNTTLNLTDATSYDVEVTKVDIIEVSIPEYIPYEISVVLSDGQYVQWSTADDEYVGVTATHSASADAYLVGLKVTDTPVLVTGTIYNSDDTEAGTLKWNVTVTDSEETSTSKHIYVKVKDIINCDAYYSVNAGELKKINGSGILVDADVTGNYNIMFFAAPFDGYALTYMGVAGSDNQYYTLTDGNPDGTGSGAWPFDSATQTTIPTTSGDSAWVDGHGFRWALLEGNFEIEQMKAMFSQAIALGCDGATNFTKNANDSYYTEVIFAAQKLPEMEKTIASITLTEEDGSKKTVNYTSGMTLGIGDTINYKITITIPAELQGDILDISKKYTVTSPITSANTPSYTTGSYGSVELTNGNLSDILKNSNLQLYEDEYYTTTFSGQLSDTTSATTETTLTYYAYIQLAAGNFLSVVDDGKIINSASLEFEYSSTYTKGILKEKSEAVAEILVEVPEYVIDFGLPVVIDLTNDPLVQGDRIKEATSKYGGEVEITGERTILYTPTSILPDSDFITLTFYDMQLENGTTVEEGSAALIGYGVRIYPATTVYYDDSFIGTGSGWSRGGTAVTVANQTAEEMNTSEEKTNKKNNYGYDPAYASVSGASHGTYLTSQTIGATTSFEFTGTGIQVFANATTETGYVSAKVTDANGAIVKVYMVDTVVDPGDTSATSGQTGSLYGLPIISIVDVTGLKHGTYTVTLTKIMDKKPVYIDGIRVFGTIADSTIFNTDLEDKPEFYELRDHVLNAVNITDTTTADQVYAAISTDSEAPAAVITYPADIYGTNATAQDLLDNGPKNELYLYKNQTLTFNVSTKRTMQIGLKAPAGQTTVEAKTTVGSTTSTVDLINNDTGVVVADTISSTVDMFYTLVGTPAGSDTTYTVKIKNTGSNILSVTLLKICDDPNAAFVPLTIEDIETILAPDAPTADASLTVNITNRSGKVMKTVTLTANGVAGETHTFTEEEILAAISDVLGKDYIAARGSSIDDVEVVYGESDVLTVDKNDDIMRIHKINNHKSRPGKGSDKGNGKHK